MSEPLTDVVDWETTDRWLFGEAWTGAHIARHARQLCDVIDPRVGDRRGMAHHRVHP